MDISSTVGGLGVSTLFVVLMLLAYFVLLFVGGIMLYMFTGKDPRPGKEVLDNLMRSATRLYSHLWMLLMALAAMIGASLFIKSILGALFAGFVYTKSSFGFSSVAEKMQENDLKLGIILLIISIIIYLFHWGIAYYVETEEEKRGTVMTKILNTFGLFITGFVFFGGIIGFIFALVDGSQAGQSLAWVLGSFPFWALFGYKAYTMINSEKAQK